jgi:antitoxin (DNA-binding transcriptional repressor) of toxin-antitoxin stability system
MATVIAQRELRNDNARIMQRVTEGEEFIVTRNGEQIAEIHGVRAPRRSTITKAELMEFVGVGPKLDLGTLRADNDALIDQSIE